MDPSSRRIDAWQPRPVESTRSAALALAAAAIAAGAAVDVDQVILDPIELRDEREGHRRRDGGRSAGDVAREEAGSIGPGNAHGDLPASRAAGIEHVGAELAADVEARLAHARERLQPGAAV